MRFPPLCMSAAMPGAANLPSLIEKGLHPRMKVTKILGATLAIFVVVVIGGLIFVSNQFDAARLKAEAIKAVQEKTQRTLKIDGELALSFWPSLGVSVGQVSLSERQSTEPFAALSEARVSVALWPLLSRQVQVSSVHLKGLQATLIRRPDGSLNVADLLVDPAAGDKAPAKEKEAAGGEALVIDIAGISVADAAFNWRDEQTGGKASVAGLQLNTGRIRLDSAGRHYSVDDLSLALKGLRDSDDGDERFEVQFEVPAFALTPTTLAAAGVKLSTVQASTHRYVKSRLALAKFDEKSPGDLVFEFEAFENDLKAKGQLSSQLSAERGALTLGLGKLSGQVEVQHPELPGKLLKLAVAGALEANLAGPSVDGGITVSFDETKAGLKFAVPTFSPLAVTADLDIDRINVDRYLLSAKAPANLPPGTAAARPAPATKAAKPLDLAFLDKLKLKAALRVGELQIRKLRIADLKVPLQAGQGRLDLVPISASLYDGQMEGALALAAEDNVSSVKLRLSGVDIGALLKDAADSDLIEGRGRVAVDLKTRGATVDDLKSRLAGTAQLAIDGGAIRGVDLGRTASELQALLGKKGAAPAAGSAGAKTEFAKLTASFTVADGIAHNDDLLATSPLLRLQGSGDINVRDNRIDYLLRAAPVQKAKTSKRRKAIDRLKEAGIPVRLSGRLDQPEWSIDQGSVVGEAAAIGLEKLQQKAEEKLGEKLNEKVGEKITDTLKGLFGR
jgi:AsmA protein